MQIFYTLILFGYKGVLSLEFVFNLCFIGHCILFCNCIRQVSLLQILMQKRQIISNTQIP